jgi:hypothetical protein
MTHGFSIFYQFPARNLHLRRSRAINAFLVFIFNLGCLAAIGQTPENLTAQSSIIQLTASIAGTGRTPGTQLGINLQLSDAQSKTFEGAALTSNTKVVPRSHLFHEDGTLKSIEIVAWLNPRYFSLYSQRHGTLTLDNPAVLALPDPSVEADDTHKRLKIFISKSAPVNEPTSIGLLIFAGNMLVADLSLALTITTKPSSTLTETAPTSPFHPSTQPGASLYDGVLSLIELHSGHVQLTFASASDMRSWRVANDLSLSEWPGYADRLINQTELKTAASNLRNFLFPDDSRCESGNDSCAAAAALFDDWAAEAGKQEPPPILVVQTLPMGKDETFTPLLMPLGILPIPREPKDPLTPEGIEHLSDTCSPSTTIDTPLPDQKPEQSPRVGCSPNSIVRPENLAEEPNTLEKPTITKDDLTDPADPNLEINRSLTGVRDPAAPQGADTDSSIAANEVENDENDTGYLAYKVLPSLPLYRSKPNASYEICANVWSIMVPPDVTDPLGGLDAAREKMGALLRKWDSWKELPIKPLHQYERSLSPIESNESKGKQANVWLILSHYDFSVSALKMPRKNGTFHSVGEGQVKRELSTPGIVFLLACETGVPATNSFLKRLITNGASTIISTNALLPGAVAGQFTTALMAVLEESGPAGVSAGDAFRKALKRLPKDMQQIVPRFVIAGDLNVRLCAPSLTR